MPGARDITTSTFEPSPVFMELIVRGGGMGKEDINQILRGGHGRGIREEAPEEV